MCVIESKRYNSTNVISTQQTRYYGLIVARRLRFYRWKKPQKCAVIIETNAIVFACSRSLEKMRLNRSAHYDFHRIKSHDETELVQFHRKVWSKGVHTTQARLLLDFISKVASRFSFFFFALVLMLTRKIEKERERQRKKEITANFVDGIERSFTLCKRIERVTPIC